MGIENNNAVIATTWDDKCLVRITKWIQTQAIDLQGLFAVVPALTNSKTTVVLCPDGSKEGWATSDLGDELRNNFIKQLEKETFDDGSSPWEWIEVGYGEYGQKILRGNNHNMYNDQDYAIEGD